MHGSHNPYTRHCTRALFSLWRVHPVRGGTGKDGLLDATKLLSCLGVDVTLEQTFLKGEGTAVHTATPSAAPPCHA
jgi:hypothetical protein